MKNEKLKCCFDNIFDRAAQEGGHQGGYYIRRNADRGGELYSFEIIEIK